MPAGSHWGQVDACLQRCVPDGTDLLPDAFITGVCSVEGPQAANGAWSPLLQKGGRPTEEGGQDLGLRLCQACRPQAVLSATHSKGAPHLRAVKCLAGMRGPAC